MRLRVARKVLKRSDYHSYRGSTLHRALHRTRRETAEVNRWWRWVTWARWDGPAFLLT